LYQSTPLQKSITVKMRALVEEKPHVFNLKEILQGFIERRLVDIQKKARFLYRENEKALLNLQVRQFIIDNYREIAEIAGSSASDEERETRLRTRFSAELKELEGQLRSIQDKLPSSEKTNDLEQEVINKILDTPASFRQFTPERREKLTRDIQDKRAENIQHQLLIEKEEVRKERLIQSRRIEARKLIPAHEERIILISRQENKKENKMRSYLTIYNPSVVEATNIPSQGKEFNVVNKSINLEEYGSKDDREYLTQILPVPEEFAEKKMVVVTKKGQKPLQEAYLNCPEFRELQKTIKEFLAREGEELIIVFKKKDKKGQVKNFQISAYQFKRNNYYSEEFKRYLTKYCSQHQPLNEEHQRADCCDKSQLVRKCDEVLDLLKVPSAISTEDLTFLLIKQDNSCDLGQTQEELGQIKLLLKETKEGFLQEVLDSSLPREGKISKKEIITQASLSITKELKEKITSSPVEEIINEATINNLWNALQG
ncbi:3396_t:CDS:2, partial [Cetraspora pellucida]